MEILEKPRKSPLFFWKFLVLYVALSKKDKFADNYPVIAAEAKDGKEYTSYPMEWYSIMYRLIDKIKADHGELNEERLRSALNDYHDQVMAL